MHPPLVMLMRRIVRDFEYDGWVLPAGGLAMVSPAAAHRLPQVFANPDRYDPDRFGPPRQEDRRTKHGLVWIFPGDPARAAERRIPDIPELEGRDRWACVPLDFTWRAHHSLIVRSEE